MGNDPAGQGAARRLAISRGASGAQIGGKDIWCNAESKPAYTEEAQCAVFKTAEGPAGKADKGEDQAEGVAQDDLYQGHQPADHEGAKSQPSDQMVKQIRSADEYGDQGESIADDGAGIEVFEGRWRVWRHGDNQRGRGGNWAAIASEERKAQAGEEEEGRQANSALIRCCAT